MEVVKLHPGYWVALWVMYYFLWGAGIFSQANFVSHEQFEEYHGGIACYDKRVPESSKWYMVGALSSDMVLCHKDAVKFSYWQLFNPALDK
jgi:hypothetical protein